MSILRQIHSLTVSNFTKKMRCQRSILLGFSDMHVCNNVVSGQKKLRKQYVSEALLREAQTGFEPVDTGVADHCLTTWLLRHI